MNVRKILLSSFFAFLVATTNAQVTTDTVSTGAGYANQTWYSLQNDEQGSAPKDNWDISFDVSSFGTSVSINSISGTLLWTYPSGDLTAWETIDTAGINDWTPQFNSETSWFSGAFDQGNNGSDPFDVGWGIYNPNSHVITGDSLFVIKLSNGQYKKLWIENVAGGAYNFKYADIDGNNAQTVALVKSAYTGKNSGYYSLINNAALDREPATADWDLLFTQYTAFIPDAYTVAGVLTNNGIEVAQADDLSDAVSYTDWSAHTFVSEINEIGYDWKTFGGMSYTIDDARAYFIKTNSGDIYKVLFTGFGGGANGNFIFTKEKLSAVGLSDISGNKTASFSVYPNPSNGENVTVVYTVENSVSPAVLTVFDLSGKQVVSEKLNSADGFYSHTLSTSGLNAGMYILSITVDGRAISQKLIIK